MVQRCRDIHGAASENLTLLEDSDVDAKVLKDFNASIDAFETLKPAPRNKKVKRSTATMSVKSLFKEADSILTRRLDKLMVKFKKTQPEFYNAYKTARVIVAQSITGSKKAETKTKSKPSTGTKSDANKPSVTVSPDASTPAPNSDTKTA